MGMTFNHVGMTVTDIAKTAAFYQHFGFEPVYSEPVDVNTPWIKEMTAFPTAHLRIQMLKLDGVTLELLQYVSPNGSNQAGMPTSNAGSAHVAVGVDDISAEVKRLKSLGVRFRSEPISINEGTFAGVKAVYCVDPDGYTVEVIEWHE
jgi:lactoylglutathione lyase